MSGESRGRGRRRAPLARPGAALALLAALAAGATPARAQGVRVTGVTQARYVELRPWVVDSIPLSQTAGSGVTRTDTANGMVVTCQSDTTRSSYCTFLRSGTGHLITTPITQDIQVSAWGLGRGISIYAHLRGWFDAGPDKELWPRPERRVEPLAAYLEIDRSKARVRLGRQYVTGGLGLYNYDGADVVLRPLASTSIDVFGGWSLARGLNEPRTSGAIAAVDNLPPTDAGLIFGGQLRFRPTGGSAFSAMYQREVRTDRGGLYSERVAADGSLRLWRGGVDVALENDLATGNWNEARLRVYSPVASFLSLSAEARHYAPFFELWTIWGAFAPVGFNEVRADAQLTEGTGALAVDLHGAWRRYGDTHTGIETQPLRDDGWRVGGDASWRPLQRWTLSGGYSMDVGFGASRSDGDAAIHFAPTRGTYIGVQGTAFQSVYEFRVGEGRVYGVGLDAGVQLADELRLAGDAMVYKHRVTSTVPTPDWSQRRASVRLEWTLGGDPGMRAAEGRKP